MVRHRNGNARADLAHPSPGASLSQLMLTREENVELHIREMDEGAVRLESAPLSLQVEPTSICNLHCTICGREAWDSTKNPPGEMPPWVIDAVTPILPSVSELLVGGYAEATLSKTMWPLLKAALDAGCPSRLISNGTRLDQAMCERLLRTGLKFLVISADGATETTMRKIRGVGLEETLAGFTEIHRAADRLNMPPPICNLSFVATRSNVHELPALIDLAADRGVSEIFVGHFKIYREELHDESLFHDVDLGKRHFDAARKRAESRGVVLKLPRFDRRNSDCLMPFQMLFVKWNGKVLACCSAVFENDHYSLAAGDLSKESIMDIWNNTVMLNYRRAVREGGELPKMCRNCAFRHDTLEAHTRLL